MATAKLILDKRYKDLNLINETENQDNNKYPLIARIYRKTQTCEISLKYKFKETEWVNNRVDKSYANSKRANSAILRRFSIITDLLIVYDRIIQTMDMRSVKKLIISELDKKLKEEDNPGLTVQEIIAGSLNSSSSLEQFGRKLIERARLQQEHATARWYKNGIDSIKQFNNNMDIAMSNITVSFLESFKSEHISRGNSKNTISAYLRAVRAITNYAIKEEHNGKRFDNYPWGIGGFSIPSQTTKKRAIKKNLIEDIKNQKIESGSELWNAQNYFIWMFNNRGMNFIDVAKLKKKQITHAVFKNKKLVSGRNEYVRSKTDKDFSIKLTADSIRILNLYDIYGKDPEDLVFPIGFEYSEKGWAEHCQRIKMNNERFRKLASLIGEKDLNLTTYVARHSWATIAKKSGISTAIIGEGLGHGDSKTTETYLEEFEEDVLDDANDLIVA
jgi:integrase/recombinase XerD